MRKTEGDGDAAEKMDEGREERRKKTPNNLKTFPEKGGVRAREKSGAPGCSRSCILIGAECTVDVSWKDTE